MTECNLEARLKELFELRPTPRHTSWASREIRARYHFYRRIWFKERDRFHLKVVIPRQLRRFAKRDDFIVRTSGDLAEGAESFCIFVYYEKGELISASVRRILRSLRRANINILLVSNMQLSDEKRSALCGIADVVMERENVGQDLGGYKDGTLWLKGKMAERGRRPRRVLYLNDSVHFLEDGLDRYVSALAGDAPVIYACEHYDVRYHLQSFAYSVSGEIFDSDKFQSFWSNFVPLSDRFYAIRFGEYLISDLLESFGTRPEVLYPTERLRAAMESINSDPRFWLHRLGKRARRLLGDHLFVRARPGLKFDMIVVELSRCGLFLTGAYVMTRALGCPFVKKCLYTYGMYDKERLEIMLPEIMPEEDVESFIAENVTGREVTGPR